MNDYGLRFHHFGLAVRYPEKATAFLKGLGYSIGERVFDAHQNVNLVMCTHASMPAVEVISQGDAAGPLDSVLSGANEMVYHLCYSCDDAKLAVGRIKRDTRVVPVSPATPAVLFGDRPVSFFRVSGFGLIELLEE